ncbi:hypothetical protein [Streptomyces drozdowiczii]|uniref:hypothetical protein n=1 Tax=Streptomyces drozdowiczii TaxID=202862 RepID=UPI00403D4493
MNKRIVLDVDRDGWTKNLQLNIATLDENNSGMGFRLAGPKYNGSSTNLLRTELDERDASEIRAALDAVFPLPDAGPVHELTQSEQEFLRFALELAADQMANRDGFDADDEAALKSLRRLTGEVSRG